MWAVGNGFGALELLGVLALAEVGAEKQFLGEQDGGALLGRFASLCFETLPANLGVFVPGVLAEGDA